MTNRILILSDAEKDAKPLQDAFKRESDIFSRLMNHEGFDLGKIAEFQPNIIIFNADEKTVKAVESYRQVRKSQPIQDVPAIFVLREEELKSEFPSGVDDFLLRPLRIPESLARIRWLYQRKFKVTDKNLVVVGGLEIDVSKYEARIRGERIDLTYTEYGLLKFLATHPGSVFSRDVLLNKVWGYEYYGGERTVDVHIRRLRSKIETQKGVRFIETVRNIGYRFMAEEEDD